MLRWYTVHTNNGWRVFSEEIGTSYLPTVSSGRTDPSPTQHVFIELPGSSSPEKQFRANIDGLDIDMPRDDIRMIAALLNNMETTVFGEHSCVKLRGRMEGVVLTNKQRWNLVDQIHTFAKGWFKE